MNVKAKMRVSSVTQYQGYEMLKFECVADDGTLEGNIFSNQTPNGNASLSLTNPNLIGTFKPGQAFYVYFELAGDEDEN